MGHHVFAKIWKLRIHPVQDSCRLHFPMDDPLLSCGIALSSSFLCSLTLFIWALPPNIWQAVRARCQPWLHHQHQPKAIQEKAPKPLIPIQRTHLCTIFHTNYLPECFTRDGARRRGAEQPCAREMQKGDQQGLPREAPAKSGGRTASEGPMDGDQHYTGLGSLMNIWS